jgi:TolB protein
MRIRYGFLMMIMLVALSAPCLAQEVASTIAFSSTRDNPTATNVFNAAEVYLMDYLTDGSFANARRLTENTAGDGFPALSPDGKGKIVFDSNRLRAPGEPLNTADLFLMNRKGHGQTFLTRGSSATWRPPGPHGEVSKMIAYHASASGKGLPIKADPGAATSDSDIFVVNVYDLLENGAQPQNITNSPTAIDDDANWSPDGQHIVFTSHNTSDNPNNSTSAEIYVMNPDGSEPQRLTFNTEEERAPSWSPNGNFILFMCRRGGSDFEICVMNADGTGQVQLTFNTIGDLTPTWSPDGQEIVFHRLVTGQGQQLFTMHADGTGEKQLTFPPGINLIATSWGEIKVGQGEKEQ